MPRTTRARAASIAIALLLGPGLAPSPSSAQDARAAKGADRRAYALTGARVLAAPGKTIDSGVVVVRGGVIEAVGPAGTPIPADAEVVDLSGASSTPRSSTRTSRRTGSPGSRAASRATRARSPRRRPRPRRRDRPSHPVSAVRADERVLTRSR
jgi:hypothetical protein